MKKTRLIIAVICYVMSMTSLMQAQQLIPADEQVPNYWYAYPETTSYVHFHAQKDADGQYVFHDYRRTGIYEDRGQMEVARYCYTPRRMKVIGVAAVLDHGKVKLRDTSGTMYQEYFNLYKASDTTLIKLASAPIDTNNTPYKILTNRLILGRDQLYQTYEKVIEAYFDEPQYVEDSFYVSSTMFNNYMVYNLDQYGRRGIDRHTFQVFLHGEWCEYEECASHADKYRYRYHRIDSLSFYFPEQYPFRTSITDTSAWFFDYNPIWHNSPLPHHLYIFPIYDTAEWNSYVPILDTCNAPTGLRIMDVDQHATTVTWDNADSVQWWELRLAHDTNRTGVVIRANTNLMTLADLDTASWYNISLRAICDSNSVDVIESPWTDTLMFYVPGDTVTPQPPVGIADFADDNAVKVSPNPANSMVSITGSATINAVEFYNAQATLVMRNEAHANHAEIDIRQLTSGVYTIKVISTNGTAVKKLIVDR